MDELMHDACERASRYLADLGRRRVSPAPAYLAGLAAFGLPLQDEPIEPALVLEELDRLGSPATVASAGGRYFGFVIGGSLPAALAANVLAAAWDQNAGMRVASPVAAALEDVSAGWLASLFGLPVGCGVGFVSGATMANFSGLAAARHALLRRCGWNVEARGLFGAPPITVLVGDEVHVSLLKALGLLGLGRERVVRVPVDSQGRMRADALPAIAGPTIVCLQAGNVNTGAIDPLSEVCRRVQAEQVWVHVDGAFGLWAAASPKRAALLDGIGLADSWATDAHKWLNVPYDSGLAFVRQASDLRAAMAATAEYLVEGERREPAHFTPELSRRARGIEIWAALRSLGRAGLAAMVDRCCDLAARFAEGLRSAGFEVLNEVVLNQVLVSFGSAERTRAVISAIQAEGTCWCGGTVWQGKAAMRISLSSWATTDEDVDRSLQAIVDAAKLTSDSQSPADLGNRNRSAP